MSGEETKSARLFRISDWGWELGNEDIGFGVGMVEWHRPFEFVNYVRFSWGSGPVREWLMLTTVGGGLEWETYRVDNRDSFSKSQLTMNGTRAGPRNARKPSHSSP